MGFESIGQDELKLNEATLLGFQQLGEHMPDGFFIGLEGEDGELICSNHQLYELFGCKDYEEFKEFTGNSYRGMVHPHDFEYMCNAVNEQLAASPEHMHVVKYRIVTKNGEVRWVVNRGYYVHTEAYGNVFFVILQDMTDKHFEDEKIKRQLEVFNGISKEYNSIYLIDLEYDKMIPYRMANWVANSMKGSFKDEEHPMAIFREFTEQFVHPADQRMFFAECMKERIISRLKEEDFYNVHFRRYNENRELEDLIMSIANVDDDNKGKRAIMGFRMAGDR